MVAFHRPIPGRPWGRADLQALAGRPVDVLRAQGLGSGTLARVTGPGEAGPGAVCGDTACMGGELPGVRRQEGVAPALTGRACCGPLHGRAADEGA